MSEKQIRVLLIDDEEELIEYLSKRLLREGFTVRAVTSGPRALETVDVEEFDVAVVDLKMPGMDGIEVQRKLKQKRPFLQTVVLTGHGSLQTALESGRQDAFRFLQKPADHGELVQALRDAAGLQAGQRLLVNGAGGGVGTFAVQLGKLLGAHVTAVASAAKSVVSTTSVISASSRWFCGTSSERDALRWTVPRRSK